MVLVEPHLQALEVADILELQLGVDLAEGVAQLGSLLLWWKQWPSLVIRAPAEASSKLLRRHSGLSV